MSRPDRYASGYSPALRAEQHRVERVPDRLFVQRPVFQRYYAPPPQRKGGLTVWMDDWHGGDPIRRLVWQLEDKLAEQREREAEALRYQAHCLQMHTTYGSAW